MYLGGHINSADHRSASAHGSSEDVGVEVPGDT